MCCLYMDDSSELHQGASGSSAVVPAGVHESSSAYGLGNVMNPVMEPLLCTDSSQSSPNMIDLTTSVVGNDELHYLSVFEQLDMFEQQNLELQVESAALHASSGAGASPVPPLVEASLEELIHASTLQVPVVCDSLPRSSSSTASSSSDVLSEQHGAEFFGAQESGATSILQQQQQPPPPPPGENAWKGQQEQDRWICDPSSYCLLPHSNNSNAVKASMFLDSKQSMGCNQLPGQQNGLHTTMRETLYRMAIWKPVNTDCVVSKPKRRNVRISSDPQTVAARHRRERISTKIKILQRLVPGGTKMDTASMLDEAIHYVKYLKSQVHAMELLEQSSSESLLLRSSTATSVATTAAAAPPAAGTGTAAASGLCHLYNSHSGLLNGSIFWPQQFSMDSSSTTGLVVQPVNISGY